MAETIGFLLILCGVGVWMAVTLLRQALSKKDHLTFDRLTVNDIGLSPEQKRKVCALAIARGISQKTLWREAILRELDGGRA